jgi:hypothetical protein
MPENSGQGRITNFYGIGTAGLYSTGAGEGSESPNVPSATAGPVIGTPAVSLLAASSQVPENRPTLAVTSGDTCGFSDDQPVHGGTFLCPPGADVTGAGLGHVNEHHPRAS